MGSTPVIRVYQRGVPVLAGTLASNTVGTGDIAGPRGRDMSRPYMTNGGVQAHVKMAALLNGDLLRNRELVQYLRIWLPINQLVDVLPLVKSGALTSASTFEREKLTPVRRGAIHRVRRRRR